MSNTLLLNSLEVHGFRAFHHLQIERLGRVNLITGKNSVGKSCLLEALWIYANRGTPPKILQLLEARDEVKYLSLRSEIAEAEQQLLNIRFLFHGRGSILEELEPVKIGPIANSSDSLTITVAWATFLVLEGGRRELQILSPNEYQTAEKPVLVLTTRVGANEREVFPLERYFERRTLFSIEKVKPIVNNVLVPADSLQSDELARLWDAVAISVLEDDVLEVLSLITRVERVTLVGDSERGRSVRIPVVRLRGSEMTVPLRSLGDGMNRLFGIALALVNAKDGMLLIDEIDSGLHYSVQPDLWRMVFAVAERLNIQVFATTHSWDCISAFQQAAAQDPASSGMLVRLSEQDGNIVSTLFDEQRLAIATHEQIEVR